MLASLKKNGATPNLIKILEKAGLDTYQSLEMLTMERPYRRIRTLVDQYLSDYSTQRLDIIDDLFLVYGIKNLTDNAQRKIGRKALKKSINKIVKRRHEIAHSGDYNQHNKLKGIEYNVVQKQISEMKTFVNACVELIVKILK